MPVIQDLRYAVRMILKSPLATLVAVVALTLGIGANISSFIAVNAMVLNPLPYPKLSRIMTVWETPTKNQSERDLISPGSYVDLVRQSGSFEALAVAEYWAATLTGTKERTAVQSSLVTPNFFQVLGMGARMGRTFTADEGQQAGSRAVVISEGFWRQHFASARDVLGKGLALNGQTYKVVGVMPDEFDYPLGNQVWGVRAITAKDSGNRIDRGLQILGLLKEGLTAQRAEMEVEAIGKRLQAQYPNSGRTLRVLPILTIINEATDRFVLLLLCAATMVLLLACANVMNIQLARAARREKEIAVRAALGASRFQIGRQLAAESVLTSLIGGCFALVIASWNLDVTKANIPAIAFRYAAGLRRMDIDSTVIAYALGISIAAGLIASIPAIARLLRQRSLTDLNEALQAGGRTSEVSSSGKRNQVQSALIVFEVAMSLVLLVGASLMVKAFNGLFQGWWGYDSKNILRLQVSLPADKYGPGEPVVKFYDRVLEQLRTLPGGQGVALWSEGEDKQLRVEGRPAPTPDELRPELDAVGGNFLGVMHMPLLHGRFVTTHDRPDSMKVAVVSESVAKAFWPHENPIGQRVKLGNAETDWLTVVGVAGDIVRDRFTNRPDNLVYVPYTQQPVSGTAFLIRTAVDPTKMAPAAQARIRAVDSELPIFDVKSMDRFLYEQVSGVKAAADAMARYASISLILAATGIFGMISYFVAQRTRDIGIHMALGANTQAVLSMTIKQTLGPCLIGVGLGLTGAYFLSELMSSVLYRFVKLDLWTFSACTLGLVATALLASYIPARRATLIDPLIALRDS